MVKALPFQGKNMDSSSISNIILLRYIWMSYNGNTLDLESRNKGSIPFIQNILLFNYH